MANIRNECRNFGIYNRNRGYHVNVCYRERSPLKAEDGGGKGCSPDSQHKDAHCTLLIS